MNKDNILKKEFKKTDVQRVRNLINKNFTASTKSQLGYKKTLKKYKEGDVWEDNDKKWTIKNGIKQNITKLDKAKKALRIPLCCPVCGKPIKHYLDKKMYKIHGFCFDCTVKMEHKLKIAGLYKKYEKRMMEGNIKTFLKDVEQWSLDLVNNNSSFITEDGEVEEWKSNSENNKKLIKDVQQYISHLSEHLK